MISKLKTQNAPEGSIPAGGAAQEATAGGIQALRRVVVLGAGAVGSLLAGKLATQMPVALIGRRHQLEAIRARGLKLEGLSNTAVSPGARLVLAGAPSELAPGLGAGDAVLLAVKAAQAEEAARELDSALAQAPAHERLPLFALQNGTGYEKGLRAALSRRWELLHAVVHVGATLVVPGRVEDWGGEVLLPDVPAGEALRLALLQAGIAARTVPDLETRRWEKIAFNCALNALSALLEVRNRETLVEELRPVRRGILQEVRQVARTSGIALPDEERLLTEFERRAGASNNVNSMLQDLRQGRPTECPFLNAAIAQLARDRGAEARLNAFLADRIAQLERARDEAQRRAIRSEARATLAAFRF